MVDSLDNTFNVRTLGNTTVLFDPELIGEPSFDIFDPEQLASQNRILGCALGRGNSFFFNYANREFVLRHFRRGGWVGRFVEDLYLGRAPDSSRAFRELRLLAAMFTDGLPVPRPVAAAFTRYGCCHRIDLITERIPLAMPLADRMEESSLSQIVWRQLGATVRQFHLKGIYHADLNARNILIDQEGAVFLIDFDRGEFRAGHAWQEDNLNRLLRSLHKFNKNLNSFKFDMADWRSFLQGYADAAS